jgi:hypothetical protein
MKNGVNCMKEWIAGNAKISYFSAYLYLISQFMYMNFEATDELIYI